MLQFYLQQNYISMKKANNQSKNKPARRWKFYLGSKERYITINCDFDSGNIQLIKQISEFQYRLGCVHDGTYTNHRANSKSWFYFCVTGFPKNTKGRFFITRVQTLSSIYHSKYNRSYRPVFKSGDEGDWERIQGDVQLVMRQGELEVVFDYLFSDENQKVYFAFSYPFTFKDNTRYIESLNQFVCCDQFYYHREIIIKSLEGRDINLLTITSYDHRDTQNQTEQLFDQLLFPQKTRPYRFSKPVVLISARVHPGESPSSFAMKGVIDFLTSKKDLRAKLLRKMFVFMIIPMINVDGVFHGHFRMDTEGKNLNRYYIKPNIDKQPAIYAIKQLATHLNTDNRLAFYFDLHAHNAKKGHFIYGNAINDFVEQVESQVFCKLVSMNNKGFQYKCCNFSQKHMNAKDRYQDLTKEGCGRVVMHRLAKIIHSYSVECGIVSANTVNWLPNCSNTQFKLGDIGYEQDIYEDNKSIVNKTTDQGNPLFSIGMYQNLGKNLMVSILDVFDKNPYNRIYNSNFKSMDVLRRLTAFEVFHEDERFRMFERFLFGKVKKINELIKEVLNEKLHYKKLYNFYFCDDSELKNVLWPQNIPGLLRLKVESPSRIKRYRSRLAESNDYIQSFKSILKGIQPNREEITQEQLQHGCSSSQKSSQTDNCEQQNGQFFSNFEQEIEYENAIKQYKNRKLQFLKQMSKIQLICPYEVKHSKQTTQSESLPQEQICKQKQIFVSKNSRQAYLRSRSFKKSGCETAKKDVDDALIIFSPQKANLTPSYLHEEITVMRNQIKNSVHYTIKQETKIRIRKQFLINKSKGLKILIQSKIKGNSKLSSPLRIRERLKSEANERNSKLQLPLITSQIQALNSSVKLLTQPH